MINVAAPAAPVVLALGSLASSLAECLEFPS
jgi:hypothetical protein